MKSMYSLIWKPMTSVIFQQCFMMGTNQHVQYASCFASNINVLSDYAGAEASTLNVAMHNRFIFTKPHYSVHTVAKLVEYFQAISVPDEQLIPRVDLKWPRSIESSAVRVYSDLVHNHKLK